VTELVRAIAASPARQRASGALQVRLLESEDLLPGWYDDWVLYERERLEQRRLRALDALARACFEAGELDTALRTAQEATRIEPLLDAMRSIVIRARLGMGDYSGALHEFQAYRRSLAEELGIEPSDELFALFDGSLLPRQRQRGTAIAT
jgi:DNA-binding SARP family transcriptional activator